MFFGRMMEPPDTPKHNAKSVTGEQSCICVLELSIFSPFLCNFPIRFWICCNRLCVCVCVCVCCFGLLQQTLCVCVCVCVVLVCCNRLCVCVCFVLVLFLTLSLHYFLYA